MRPEQLREGGPFEVDTFRFFSPNSLTPNSFWTVYADRDCPSHCVRLWQWVDESQQGEPNG